METAWIITGVLIPAALALGGALMADLSSVAHLGACLSFIVAAIWLAVVGAMWLHKKDHWDWTVRLRAAGIAVYVILLTPFLVWVAWPTSAQTPPSVKGNCNNFGNNNFNCNTFNLAPRKMQFTDEVKSQLLSSLPKGRPGIVKIVGAAQEEHQIGHQILDFLLANGYDVKLGDEVGAVMPAPEHPLTFLEPPGENSWILIVAPWVPYEGSPIASRRTYP